jgi:hypothetical protein
MFFNAAATNERKRMRLKGEPSTFALRATVDDLRKNAEMNSLGLPTEAR